MRTIPTKFLISVIVSLKLFNSSAQPHISYDTLTYDLGQIEQPNDMISKRIWFTNTGNEPLIITEAHTGDGGSMVDFIPREPIAPGKRGSFIFRYDSHRIGVFTKGITVGSNAVPNNTGPLLKGEVIYRKTKIATDSSERIRGNLEFGDIDTVRFYLKNTGNQKLHIYYDLNRWYYAKSFPDIDLTGVIIKSRDTASKISVNQIMPYNPGERVEIDVIIHNIFGNAGEFERKLYFIYNSHDTLVLKIRGHYTGKPYRQKIFWMSNVYYYENDKLVRMEAFDFNGSLNTINWFEGAYCAHLKKNYFDYGSGKPMVEEIRYKKDIIISDKKYEVK